MNINSRYSFKQQKGMILIVSLLISFVVALLITVELSNLNLSVKGLSEIKTQKQLFYTVEKKLLFYISYPEVNCLVSAENANTFPEFLHNAAIPGCQAYSENNIEVRYAIEDLGENACLIIETQLARLYRITVYGHYTGWQGSEISLQGIYSEKSQHSINSADCPNQDLKNISTGLLSWRKVY